MIDNPKVISYLTGEYDLQREFGLCPEIDFEPPSEGHLDKHEYLRGQFDALKKIYLDFLRGGCFYEDGALHYLQPGGKHD